MTLLVGVGIGIFFCHWLAINAKAKQQLLIQQAQNDILMSAVAKNPSILTLIQETEKQETK